ncbi:MAG: hypothetical protein KF752_20945 [Pirellulaceae bacterium]|nr:hypothetical protein [Pirellulaceae bacterium]
MTEFDFTLILSGLTDFDDAIVDRLVEAGCSDATIARRYGRVYITFSREANSLVEAVVSAIGDVKRANVGASVMRIDSCNLVTPAEIGRRLGRSRQAIDQYITGSRGPGGFPAPACNITDGAPLYYWCEVAYWAVRNNLLSQQANKEAQELATLNTILELEHQKQIAPEITDALLKKFQVCDPSAVTTTC